MSFPRREPLLPLGLGFGGPVQPADHKRVRVAHRSVMRRFGLMRGLVRQLRVARLLVLFLPAFSCGQPTSLRFPEGALELQPLAPYRTWWHLVESCSGRAGNFEAVRYFVASDIDPDDAETNGVWFSAGNRIVLTPEATRLGAVVRHEMLHALLRRPGHPREAFAERCAGLVTCGVNCKPPESTRGVPTSAPNVPPASLDVSVSLDPAVPSESVDSGWVRVTVSARNVSDDPVWVSIPTRAPFTLQVVPWGLTHSRSEQLQWAFKGHESRAFSFDAQLKQGAYVGLGSFSTYRARYFSFEVRP